MKIHAYHCLNTRWLPASGGYVPWMCPLYFQFLQSQDLEDERDCRGGGEYRGDARDRRGGDMLLLRDLDLPPL